MKWQSQYLVFCVSHILGMPRLDDWRWQNGVIVKGSVRNLPSCIGTHTHGSWLVNLNCKLCGSQFIIRSYALYCVICKMFYFICAYAQCALAVYMNEYLCVYVRLNIRRYAPGCMRAGNQASIKSVSNPRLYNLDLKRKSWKMLLEQCNVS